MNYTPQQIANYFLARAFESSVDVSPLKLLKLVYIAYGWNLALRDKKLFHEPIEAWEHGPVVPTLYHEFKHYRKNPIKDFAEDYDAAMESMTVPRVPQGDSETLLVLQKVWAAYKHFSAWTLRNKTHEKDGPWDKVYDRHRRDVILNDADIREHYKVKIGQYLDAARTATA